ncbi:NAD-dependent epimerase/dehydratase family protein [Echinicola jeungdonensis]|uniref:NAD-dependent epimerase/dehydratase family protein n=1 Tax=Echinicola jeungdonensis TaxID=709343 RepID=A0ABV5J6A0_9BACT|nr:NAD-dependent epimerase/dehydratase family protein [Echinicola jeungdonensis]MDN3669842.1 NAD-dependent epimerase/dehydratase family protein [Echinicola jeungdonensis]
MQTILGSGGIIGTLLAQELRTYTDKIRLVSRNPKVVNSSDETKSANLLQAQEVMEAVAGSEIVYLTVGFEFNTALWQKIWPLAIKNVIEACSAHQCKLVFFDNVFMYDPFHLNPMTENTPVNPSSKKGKVRAIIAKMVMDAVENGKINALIARSADFYGPGTKKKGLLNELVFLPLAKGNNAKWIASSYQPHSFTFTPDAGKATALLGNTPEAFNQIWHLPTAGNPPTGKEWVYMIAEEMGAQPSLQVIYKWIFHLASPFSPLMREVKEMLYQYDRPYVFDSSKFEKQFYFKPTSYLDGIRKILETDYPRHVASRNEAVL